MRQWWRVWQKKRHAEIHPDEILIDSSNLPEFDRDQFEGRIERPLTRRSFALVGALLTLVSVGLMARAGDLQIIRGVAYAKVAEENQLAEEVIFADRGTIVDRNGVLLAYNARQSVEDEFAKRVYDEMPGLAHVVGYVKPPAKDFQGVYYRDEFIGMD